MHVAVRLGALFCQSVTVQVPALLLSHCFMSFGHLSLWHLVTKERWLPWVGEMQIEVFPARRKDTALMGSFLSIWKYLLE